MASDLQLFPPPGWVDPAIYLGHFLNLPDLIDRFGQTYFALRWMWILAGAGAYAVFQPDVAHHLIVLSLVQIAVWSLFGVLRPLVGRWAAIAGAASLATMPAFLAAVTSGYVDGLAIALILVTGVALRRLPAPWGPAVAGAAAMAAANAHPFAVLVAGFWFAAHAVEHLRDWRRVGRDALLAIAGAVACLLLFCVISWAMGGSFLYFLAIMQTAATQVALGGKFALTLDAWLPNAATLHVAGAVALVALALTGSDRPLVLAMAFLAVTAGIFAGFDALSGGSTLQYPFYTSYLAAPVALLIGCVLARADRIGPLLPLLTALAGAAPIFAGPLLSRPDDLVSDRLVILALYGVAVTAAVTLAVSRLVLARTLTAVAGVLLLMGCGIFAVSNAQARSQFVGPVGVDFRDFHMAATRFVRSMQAASLQDRRLLFWFTRADFTTDEPARDARLPYRLNFAGQQHALTFYDSLAGLYLWDRVMLQDNTGPLSDRAVAQVAYATSPMTVVLLGQRHEDEALARRRLTDAGVSATLRAKFDINAGKVQFFAWLLDVTPGTSATPGR